MSEHTPGPWRVEDGHDGHGHWHYSIGARHQWPEGEAAFCALAFTPPLGVGPYAVNRQADAHLIAAAPDLFEALKDLMVSIESDEEGDEAGRVLAAALTSAAVAIAKAEGR